MNKTVRIFVAIISIFFYLGVSDSFAKEPNYESQEKDIIEIKSNTAREYIIIKLHDDEEWEYMIFTPDKTCIRMGMLKKGRNKISMKDMCKGEYSVYISKGEERIVTIVTL